MTRAVAVRMRKLAEQEEENDLAQTTAAERLAMMWTLALNAWALKGEPLAEPRLQRHVVRVLRPIS